MTSRRSIVEALVSRLNVGKAERVLYSNGQVISISSNDENITSNLIGLFIPYAYESHSQRPHFIVQVIIDQKAASDLARLFFDVMERAHASSIQIAEGIDVVSHRDLASGRICLWHIVYREERLIFSVGKDRTAETVYEAFRTVRILFHVLFLEAGLIPIHAATVSRDAQALCFLGNKYAGKTTTALQCIQRLGWNYISNDKSYLNAVDGEFVASALPVRAGIRWDTVDRIDSLLRFSEESGRTRTKHDRLYCSSREIADLFGVAVERSATVVSFVYLSREADLSTARMQALDAFAGTAALKAQVTPDDAFQEHPYWGSLLKDDALSVLAASLVKLVERVNRVPPSFMLHYSGIDYGHLELIEKMWLEHASG